MTWNQKFDKNNPPSREDMSCYIKNPLWETLLHTVETTYRIQPKLAYSGCSMQPGWNVKYQKSGRSLCTLYPMDGFFLALVVIGNRERVEAEQALPSFSQATQTRYTNTPFAPGGKWLMLQVTEPEIVDDLLYLIQLKARP